MADNAPVWHIPHFGNEQTTFCGQAVEAVAVVSESVEDTTCPVCHEGYQGYMASPVIRILSTS